MTQSGFIAAALIFAFVLFLAAKNRLNAYTAVIWGPTAAPLPTANQQSSGFGGTSADTIGNLGGTSSAMGGTDIFSGDLGSGTAGGGSLGTSAAGAAMGGP